MFKQQNTGRTQTNLGLSRNHLDPWHRLQWKGEDSSAYLQRPVCSVLLARYHLKVKGTSVTCSYIYNRANLPHLLQANVLKRENSKERYDTGESGEKAPPKAYVVPLKKVTWGLSVHSTLFSHFEEYLKNKSRWEPYKYQHLRTTIMATITFECHVSLLRQKMVTGNILQVISASKHFFRDESYHFQSF